MKAAAKLVVDATVTILVSVVVMTVATRSSLVRAYHSISKSTAEEWGNLGALRIPCLASKMGSADCTMIPTMRGKSRRGVRRSLRRRQHVHASPAGLQDFAAPLAVGFGYRQQDLLKAGPPVTIDGRK